MNEALRVSPEPVYKPRRAHKKSRNGCVGCKQRRTKCDEAAPRCSRCAKRGLCCQYRQSASDSTSIIELRFVSHSQSDNVSQNRLHSSVANRVYTPSISMRLPPTLYPLSSQIPPPLSGHGEIDKLYTVSHPHEILDWAEVELLSHYLTHTSRIIPFDIEELYALRVGMPSLAFRSRALMSSILALAAVCKSNDLVERPQQDRDKILDLLNLADRHHRASLLQVQRDLPNASQYDYILANSTLMVLYALGLHSVTIRLSETQTKDESLPAEFIPRQSQWISLIRAADLAFVGLLNDHPKTTETGHENIGASPTRTLSSSNGHAACMNEIIYPVSGPTERTKEFLFPILAASSGPALDALRTKARTIQKAEYYAESWTRSNDCSGILFPSNCCNTSLEACFTSIDILTGIMAEVFSSGNPCQPSTASPKQFESKLEPPPLGRLSTVSSWLQSYVARVTSSAAATTQAPRPLRRVIMAFLNRVPAEYLRLVQTTLDSINDEHESSDLELLNSSTAHKLAMDIFAHWAVLVMLLDGVWWISGVGAWELRRAISFVRAQGWLDSLVSTGESWWPESMYNVGRELRTFGDKKECT